jgi:hypothetical protein
VNSALNPIEKFDASGNFAAGFGQGLFNHPHGFYVDRDGNVWTTDNVGGTGKAPTCSTLQRMSRLPPMATSS